MITPNNKLNIFQVFVFDRSLPKFKKERTEAPRLQMSVGGVYSFAPEEGLTENIDWNRKQRQPSFWIKVFRFICFWRIWKNRPSITVQEFFTHIKGEVEGLSLVRERAAGYEKVLKEAHNTGQTALKEKLTQQLHAVRGEAHLFDLDLKKFITADTLIKFVKQSPKGLRLDWLPNFTRRIPKDCIERKKKCDDRFVFDNYVILHYDPKGKSYRETKAEAEARRDPILFGVMEGRERLYFIGDWIDEECDLTLEDIATALGTEAIEKIE